VADDSSLTMVWTFWKKESNKVCSVDLKDHHPWLRCIGLKFYLNNERKLLIKLIWQSFTLYQSKNINISQKISTYDVHHKLKFSENATKSCQNHPSYFLTLLSDVKQESDFVKFHGLWTFWKAQICKLK
jgi:hypothetical protein